MINSWHVIGDPGTYSQQRFDEISSLEGVRPSPYRDTKGIPSVGIGFNLRTENVRRAVFEAMEINAQDQRLSPVQQAAEQGYINQLTAAAQQTYSSDAALQLALNNIMVQRSMDPLLMNQAHIAGRNTFEMQTNEIRTTFDAIIGGYETAVDNWLAGIPQSNEREALVSLAYNGLVGVNANGTFKSASLRQAIINDDRAEAWYEIRYRSNGDQLSGIATRRYDEAQLFGLYNGPIINPQPTEAEAKAIFQMYTTHRETIAAYESNPSFAPTTHGALAFKDESILAHTLLATNYAEGRTIDGDILVGQDVAPALAVSETLTGTSQGDLIFGEGGMDRLEGLSGADVLYGGEGSDTLLGGNNNDLLIGEAGFDVLEGGSGNDELRGGADFDTYRSSTGDGQDTITDSDGLGAIVYDGDMLTGGIHRAGDAANTYTSANGQFTFVQSGTTLTMNGQLTVENWQPGDLGVTLRDLSTLPTGTAPVIDYNNGLSSSTIVDGDEDNAEALLGAINYVVYGNGGDDYVLTGLGNDQLFGGMGHDYLESGRGNDRLYGEAGRDNLVGRDGDDVLDGGDDIDSLKSGYGNDYLDGGAGDDGLNGEAGADILHGGTGNDLVYGDAVDQPTTDMGNDYLDGGADADWLFGLLGNDVILGGTGADHLYGDTVPDTAPDFQLVWPGSVITGSVASFSSFDGGTDYLDGGAGDDYLQGDGGDDVLLGGDDNDTLYGDDLTLDGVQQGNDLLDGGSGNDTLYGGGGNDTLLGGSDNDTLIGDFSDDPLGGDDILDGGAGNDVLQGGRGNDILSGGTEDDQLFGQIGDDVLYGGAGIDTLQGEEGNDLLYGGSENDLLFGQAGSDFLSGDDGNDELQGGDDADTLLGGDGDDRLFGQDGDDLLIGGTGTDTLVGGLGADTYVFNLGDGVETIFDTAGEGNRLVFGAGITADSISLGVGSLLIRIGSAGDAIHIEGFDQANPTVPTGIAEFQFADGTVLTQTDLIARGFDLFGTSGDDLLNTGEFYQRAYGLDGADQLIGGTAGNTLDGGAGVDVLWGRTGNDTLLGGAEGDTLYGEEGNDQLTGGEGNDTLSGGDGDDTLDGGTGSDVLAGDAGHDVYVLAVGDGTDTIQDIVTGTAYNAIRFGAGILPTDLAYVESINILTITYSATGDNVQLVGFDREGLTGSLVVSTLQFTDGSLVNLADLFPGNRAPTVANPMADQTVLEDAPFSVVVPANTFADQDVGDDLTLSASLSDGTALPAWLSFDPLTRTFSGTPDDAQVGTLGLRVTATDHLNAAVATTFSLTITNVNEAPTLVTALADQSARETEAFTFVVLAGAFADVDPGDTLTYSATLDTGAGLPTWLSFDPVTRTFSGMPQSGDVGAINVRVTATDTGSLTVSDVFALTVQLNHQFTGTPGNDILTGTSGDDVLQGLGGNDVLSGLAGNDTLDGGTGADSLSGGDGDDILYIDSTDYSVSGGAGTDTVYVVGTAGVSLNLGTTGVEVVYGNVGNDSFTGGSLSGVVIDAGAGNDTLTAGGTYDDILIGGAGDDTYYASQFVTVIEQLDSGIDTMVGGVPQGWVVPLAANVENLTVLGGPGSRVDGTGNELDNIIIGGDASNVLRGLDGNDTIYGNGGVDQIYGGAGDDWLSAGTSNPFQGEVEVLQGEEGNDTLVGGDHGANLVGGPGDDTYLIDAGSAGSVFEGVNEGTDTVKSSLTYTVPVGQEVEIVILTGSSAINGTGNEFNNTIIGNSAVNILTGGVGNDTLDGGDGADTLDGGDGNDTLLGGLGNDSLTGGAGDDTYIVDSGDTIVEASNGGTDTVQSSLTYTLGTTVENLMLTGTSAINGTGNALDNVLTGNSAANVLTGGAGNDTYIVGSGDTVSEASNGGTDTVQSSLTYTLGANVENLTLTGTSAVNGTGNSVDNVLTGNSAANTLTGVAGNDTLNGGAGADTLVGGTGNDTYVVDDSGDVVNENAGEGTDTVQSSITYTLGVNVENLTLTGTAAINGTGNALNNTMNGNSGANVLDGGLGADAMSGGAGDDTYVVDNTADTVTEAASAGIDTVQSSVTYTLAANVENLTLTGSTAINGTGNGLDNVLIGNSAANVLTGGAGNDTYVVGSGDSVVEKANGGTDTVQSATSFVLGSNVENLILTGTAAINGTGNTANNVLAGNSAANVLDGAAGADTMSGGAGGDTYVVDSTGDTIVEIANEGIDIVQSSVTFTLASNVDNLTLTGTSAISGTGNGLDNVLTGNSGANVLTGGAGNDTYVVGTGDSVVENANEGTDTVQSAITWTLGANLENLTLTGTSAINGTGNTLNNVLSGNSANNKLTGGAGNDTLDGGAGADTLVGSTGDDTYVVDATGDIVTELVNEGTDSVQSGVTHTLGSNVENLTLTGAIAINGTGNTLNNILTGNSAANTLMGAAGNDTLAGGQGNDVLNGGTGNDLYLVSRGDGQETIQDADATAGNADRLLYGATINPLDLVLSRQVNDLRLAIHGGTEQVTIQNWYTSPTTNQVETIQAGNGQMLLSTQVDQLIQAMAGFTQQTGLTWDQAIDQRPQDVQTVLAASWQ
jgi:Ca2+-binding RTX toxin-like protein/GH24 family phage-related lysozyme (muramidase)